MYKFFSLRKFKFQSILLCSQIGYVICSRKIHQFHVMPKFMHKPPRLLTIFHKSNGFLKAVLQHALKKVPYTSVVLAAVNMFFLSFLENKLQNFYHF